MKKCDKCGKEAVSGFRCPYCGVRYEEREPDVDQTMLRWDREFEEWERRQGK